MYRLRSHDTIVQWNPLRKPDILPRQRNPAVRRWRQYPSSGAASMHDSINHERRRFIGAAAAGIAAARFGVIGTVLEQMACAALVNEGALPSLSGATEWINSPPLTSEGLRGKVVLVDFWTY